MDKIFKIVTDKLNEHNIPWWPEAGSMLGCYREGKRIEWDDDYDIGYPVEYAKSVLEALLELNEFFINYNLNFKVKRVEGFDLGNHYVCVMPHLIDDTGVFKLSTPLRHIINKTNRIGFYTIPEGTILLINKLVRKLPLSIQKLIVKINIDTFISVRFRGTKEEYSSWHKAKLGDVEVMIPAGVESILERRYGGDFMTPRKKEDYTDEDILRERGLFHKHNKNK